MLEADPMRLEQILVNLLSNASRYTPPGGRIRLAAGLEGGQVVTAAPKEKQLELHAWKEIGKHWTRFTRLFPEAELTKLRIRMQPGRDDWGAVGFVAGVSASEVSASATRAHGFHGEHMLFILEELTGIGAVINTSFNDQEPMVETPRDALRAAAAMRLDFLLCEDALLVQ